MSQQNLKNPDNKYTFLNFGFEYSYFQMLRDETRDRKFIKTKSINGKYCL